MAAAAWFTFFCQHCIPPETAHNKTEQGKGMRKTNLSAPKQTATADRTVRRISATIYSPFLQSGAPHYIRQTNNPAPAGNTLFGPPPLGSATFFPYVSVFWSAAVNAMISFYGAGRNSQTLPSAVSDSGWFKSKIARLTRAIGSSGGRDDSQLRFLQRLSGAGRQSLNTFFYSHAADLLSWLLGLLGCVYASNPALRKHIKNFDAHYQFIFADRNTPVAAVFHAGRIRTSRQLIKAPHVTLVFRNSDVLKGLFLSPNPDILAAILKQDIIVKGNLTYLYKLAFLARHLQCALTGEG
jgi:hypothetical protein